MLVEVLTARLPGALAASRRAPRPLDAPRSLRILVAEDNLINQKVALHMLEQLGYRADAVANGVEVLDALERQPYDIVFMDLQMPERNGLGATRDIRRLLEPERQPYIVALTANAMYEDRQACLDAGMDDYISKPVHLETLRTSLERALDRTWS
jgi:CheY-like chemotaxis protein